MGRFIKYFYINLIMNLTEKIGLGIMAISTISAFSNLGVAVYNVNRGNKYALQVITLRDYSENPDPVKLAEFDDKRKEHQEKGKRNYKSALASCIPLVIGNGIVSRGRKRRYNNMER